MAFDAPRGKVVLFGGIAESDAIFGDTWTWDGTTWTQASPASSPGARYGHAMAFDATRGEVVLFAGRLPNATTGDTWIWDGATWTQKFPPSSPPTRTEHAMAFDAVRGEMVLFGGLSGSTGDSLNDTWTWNGTTWTKVVPTDPPPARSDHSMAFDAARHRVILFDGLFAGDTWLFHFRGGTCSTAADCDTGHCVDGTCCDAASCGTCQACNLATSPGVCASVTGAPDPDSCSGTRTCSAAGQCGSALGQGCTSGAECASGFCVDGACCAAASCGACQACSMAFTGQASGTCADVAVGKTHATDCAVEAPTTCGHDGTCDGEGGCRNYANGTSCGKGAMCSGGTAIGNLCDGSGHCGSTATTVPCGAYACTSGVGCLSSCRTDADCAPMFTCSATTHGCVPNDAASCDGAHTLTAPSGTKMDCAPYVCSGTSCKTTCASVVDCVFPNECTPEGQCVTVARGPSAPAGSSGGCSCVVGVEVGQRRGGVFAMLAAVLAFVARRKRRAVSAADVERVA
jgi:hypothetical protein